MIRNGDCKNWVRNEIELERMKCREECKVSENVRECVKGNTLFDKLERCRHTRKLKPKVESY